MASSQLDELTKWAASQNSPTTPRTPKSRQRLSKSFSAIAEKLQGQRTTAARDNANELSQIRSAEELRIDLSRALSMKRGDLAIIQGEVFKCSPIAPHLAHIPLVIKRLECVDRRTYDLKVYEADTLARFQGHPNIVSLYSYWSEKPASSYVFKTLVLLLEEGIMGDVLHTVIMNRKQRPKLRMCYKYLCDMCKGLIAIHGCNIIHGRIKPSSMYLSAVNTLMLGEFGKTELDSARQTHQLFSKVLIREATPRTLVYWSPELLKLDSYGKEIDLWALGVSFYQLVTQQHPFTVDDENRFRDDALNAKVNWEPLQDPKFERARSIIDGLLKVNPTERMPAMEVLRRAQEVFAVDIQKVWRGHRVRKQWSRIKHAAMVVKAVLRGQHGRKTYLKTRDVRREAASVVIQKTFRMHLARKTYRRHRELVLRCQAHVLAWQGRRAFVHYRKDTILCQSLVRRYLAHNWFQKIREQRKILEAKLLTIQTMIYKYKQSYDQFKELLGGNPLPHSLQHLESFEDFELAQPPKEYGAIECLPKLRASSSRIAELQTDIKKLQTRCVELDAVEKRKLEEESRLRDELGSKFEELDPMIDALKKSLKRVEEACKRAQYLPIKVQHPYQYSKWDLVHEPNNVVENVLKDDEAVFRSLSPSVDLTLCNGSLCFVSEVEICPGECGPAHVEVYTSNVLDKWTFVKSFKCTRDATQPFRLPGEQLCKYLRFKMDQNVRGGNIVTVRMVRVKGLVKE